MEIFGHRFIKSDSFYHISSIDGVINTPSSSTLYLEFSEENLDIIEHLSINSLKFALTVETIKEVILASALGATYVIIAKELSKDAQSVANNYLFDMKILVHVESDDEIEEMGLASIDGIIYSDAVVKIVS